MSGFFFVVDTEEMDNPVIPPSKVVANDAPPLPEATVVVGVTEVIGATDVAEATE